MLSFFDVTVDFDRSHLIFPILVSAVLAVLGAVILATRRAEIGAALAATPRWPAGTDRMRLFGTVVLVIIYFLAMERIGRAIPNRGFGFLFASAPFVLAISLLYMHGLSRRRVIIAVLNAVIAPLVVWFILSSLFNISLP
ncbi:tripartite tricarboxylate transporter TctB family protein [Puniceibacterium confluentis]|uniref:tripartite tricarboxylate transporter TctB family protein n=1 Tax=Puniceibacterium confluentis TaxID=1958944 RepID=UPI0011B55492|nr:tripartite tricarboxylate transporter TctB family protein [Puniceibacterium confluentis]